MADIEHVNIPDVARHEPRGASTASLNTVIKSDGNGGTKWEKVKYSEILEAPSSPVSQGWWIYEDDDTSAIPLTVASTYYQITNDGEGAGTIKDYGLTSAGEIFDTTSNNFDFSQLSLGDVVEVVVEVEVSAGGNNHKVDMYIEAGLDGTPYDIQALHRQDLYSSGTHTVVGRCLIPIKDANTKENPAKIKMSSSDTGDTVTPKKIFVRVMKNG